MSFSEIVGQDKPVAILKTALKSGRIAHAYLFYGMEGIGKRTTADLFARALVCSGGDPPCGNCPSCRKAAHGNHPDLITVRAEGQFIKIAAVKELRNRMMFRPTEGAYRVFILPEADRMNAAAANALLKTLEEPTAGNILLLTTARPHALPMTILSRCQHLRFSPLPRQDVALFLREREGLSSELAMVLAASAGGSIGRALEMNREDPLARRDAILADLAADDPADPLRRLIFAGHLGTERDEIIENLRILQGCYRDALLWRETGERQRLAFPDRGDLIERIAARLDGPSLLANLALIDAAASAVDLNANKSLTLENMVIKLA
jgi:DNA polymerase-3 subunit delta'